MKTALPPSIGPLRHLDLSSFWIAEPPIRTGFHPSLWAVLVFLIALLALLSSLTGNGSLERRTLSTMRGQALPRESRRGLDPAPGLAPRLNLLENNGEYGAVGAESSRSPAPSNEPHWGKGEWEHARDLSALTNVSIEEIVALRESGLGWGQVAHYLGTTLGAAARAGAGRSTPTSPPSTVGNPHGNPGPPTNSPRAHGHGRR